MDDAGIMIVEVVEPTKDLQRPFLQGSDRYIAMLGSEISERSGSADLGDKIEFMVFLICPVRVEPNDVFVVDIAKVTDLRVRTFQSFGFVIVDVNLIPGNFNTFY